MSFVICGGSLRGPFDLSFVGDIPVTHDDMMRNVALATARQLPGYQQMPATSSRLAVVGGGPSIKDHIETLRTWDGDIWAINGAWRWLADQGIDSVFLAVDPHPIVATWCVGAKRALLSTRCDPSVFDALKDAQVYVFSLNEEGVVKCGSSTATAAPHLGVLTQHYDITFFGCESSYAYDATHAYMREPREQEMALLCGGQMYLTAPDYYCQALELSCIVREFGAHMKEQSGGLLQAMVRNPEFTIVWISEGLARSIKPLAAVLPDLVAAQAAQAEAAAAEAAAA